MRGPLFLIPLLPLLGAAISLIFGIFVSTVLTLVVIPTLYYAAYRHRGTSLGPGGSGPHAPPGNSLPEATAAQ